MKRIIIIIFAFVSINISAQVRPELRISIDPVVLLNESNYNIKIEIEDGTYGNNRHRIIIGAEILTGHSYYALSGGYGYHIPYNIFGVDFSIQPGFNIGVIYREFNNVQYLGYNHFWTLRHRVCLGNSWGVYTINRIIDRPDIRAQGSNQYYFIDNAIGIYFKL